MLMGLIYILLISKITAKVENSPGRVQPPSAGGHWEGGRSLVCLIVPQPGGLVNLIWGLAVWLFDQVQLVAFICLVKQRKLFLL